MAPIKTESFSDAARKVFGIITSPEYFRQAGVALIVLEALVLAVIILAVPYTEIDWVAYMQEVEGVVNGTFDYTQLRGDTGPLVYPAGFVYIYMALYYLTNHGANVYLAQHMFAVLYIATLTTILAIYSKVSKGTSYPPYMVLFLGCTAYRVHSIFVLRLFNDPVAMFFLYCSVLLFVYNHWTLGCLLYSLAVSVKMNVLLFSPGLLVLLLMIYGWKGTFPRLMLCAAVQLLLGAPFLLANPPGYINGAFDFGRQFFFKWTVNWRCIPEWLFLHRAFHLALIVGHLTLLVAFTTKHWTRLQGLKSLIQWEARHTKPISTSSLDISWILFTSNFIGLCFSRSLHYQFYVWYFHSLPLLLWTIPTHPVIRVILLLVIEYCWNVYPSTVTSSLLLHFAHVVILTALYFRKDNNKYTHKLQ